jgi:outer membrane murein-binding lipoprotein Lpp
MVQISAAQVREIVSDIQTELTKVSELEQQIKTTRLQMAANPNLASIFYESLVQGQD